jgi:hypothetical protein
MSIIDDQAFRYYVSKGNVSIVQILLSIVDPREWNNYAIRKASENGHINMVVLLLKDPRIDPSDFDNYALRLASENGHFEVVKLLLDDPRVIESMDDLHRFRRSIFIEKTYENGHDMIVNRLLQLNCSRKLFTLRHVYEIYTRKILYTILAISKMDLSLDLKVYLWHFVSNPYTYQEFYRILKKLEGSCSNESSTSF